jgi:hypothetical protein
MRFPGIDLHASFDAKEFGRHGGGGDRFSWCVLSVIGSAQAPEPSSHRPSRASWLDRH